MTKIEHPFTKVYRTVLKEKYPDKAVPDDSPLSVSDIPEDVISEALNRYYAGKKLVAGPRVWASPSNTIQKQEIKRTITYV